jgi:hypothetical protein
MRILASLLPNLKYLDLTGMGSLGLHQLLSALFPGSLELEVRLSVSNDRDVFDATRAFL